MGDPPSPCTMLYLGAQGGQFQKLSYGSELGIKVTKISGFHTLKKNSFLSGLLTFLPEVVKKLCGPISQKFHENKVPGGTNFEKFAKVSEPLHAALCNKKSQVTLQKYATLFLADADVGRSRDPIWHERNSL